MPARTLLDIVTSAAQAINAIPLGELLSSEEAQQLLTVWQQLIDSSSLESANVHTVREDSYLLTPGENEYTLGFDPTAPALEVSDVTQASPCVLTVTHGIPVGQTCSVMISGGTAKWDAINAGFIASALSASTLSIPLDTTSFGASADMLTVQIAGTWNYIRPNRVRKLTLTDSAGWVHPVYLKDFNDFGSIHLPETAGRSYKAYVNYDAPVCLIKFFPIPSGVWTVDVYSEQSLNQVTRLSDTVVFAQGYERLHTLSLAVECAPYFGLEPTPSLMNNLQRAERAVQGRNRHSPSIKTDEGLSCYRDRFYFRWFE